VDALIEISGQILAHADPRGLAQGIPSFAALGGWLWVAFGLGLIHAFDADHVMALSVLATDEKSGRRGLRAGLRWSLGHGLVLLVVGVVLFGLGRSLPPEIASLAERAVGVVMIGLGVYVFADLARRRSHVHFHTHDGLAPHAHWHSHTDSDRHSPADRHQHQHAASMVGALHGLAGSAPILALLPAAARTQEFGVLPLVAHLLVFGLGVAFAMAGVSGAFGHLAGRFSRARRSGLLSGLRLASATGSIAVGLWLSAGA
jgi:hypothetical protein